MTQRQWEHILGQRMDDLLWEYPALKDYLDALQLPFSSGMALRDLPSASSDRWLRDRAQTPESLLADIRVILEEETDRQSVADRSGAAREKLLRELRSLTVYGGHDKDGKPDGQSICLCPGDTVCVTGTTGAGKTCLLEDIECLADGDTPSGRHVLMNGKALTHEERGLLENRLCACLSQTMNFVLELSCREFVELHANCRGLTQIERLLEDVLRRANQLAGEPIEAEMLITQLSGGQSRAFMIADLVCISEAPVVLIDEPENAGIDKHAVLSLLSGSGKIVLVSTHDPVLALSCEKRIVLKNGAVAALLERTEHEALLLHQLEEADRSMQRIRDALRDGRQL